MSEYIGKGRHEFFNFSAILTIIFFPAVAVNSFAAVTSSTQHGLAATALDGLISSSDLIQGQNTVDVDVYENPGDLGWYYLNTDPADQLAAFTDGIGRRAPLTGLLNDLDPPNTGTGIPVKVVEYPLSSPSDIGRINIFTGNGNNADGRIFSTTFIEYSTNDGATFEQLGYFQSDPSGSVNDENNPVPPLDPAQHVTMVSIFDSNNSMLVSGVTNIIFTFYSVANTMGEMRDPFDGVNPFTGLDDGLTGAFVSPEVWEIDVLPPSEGLVGDYNMDNKVDAADYVLWRETDIDGQLGYSNWRANFGATQGAGVGSVSVIGVPEPSTLIMLTVGVGLALVRRKRATGKVI